MLNRITSPAEGYTVTGSASYNAAEDTLAAATWDAANEYYTVDDGRGNPVIAHTLLLTPIAVAPSREVDDGKYPPSFKSPSEDTEIELEGDGSATVSVSASGEDGLQWQRRTPGGIWQDIPGATNYALGIGGGEDEDGTQYRCFASNKYGNVASATFTVRIAKAVSAIDPAVEPPQTGDGHTVAGYAMLLLLAVAAGLTAMKRRRG